MTVNAMKNVDECAPFPGDAEVGTSVSLVVVSKDILDIQLVVVSVIVLILLHQFHVITLYRDYYFVIFLNVGHVMV